MNAIYMTSKFFQRLNRVDAISCPMPYISTRADIFVPFDGGKHRIRTPVNIRFWMIMNSHFYTIGTGHTIYHIPLIFERLCSYIAQSEFFGKVKCFFPLLPGSGYNYTHGNYTYPFFL